MGLFDLLFGKKDLEDLDPVIPGIHPTKDYFHTGESTVGTTVYFRDGTFKRTEGTIRVTVYIPNYKRY
ncbi:hypothetical protein HQ489_01195 [Candidatus Woesearchaeota archaeon]|nr:hypothetical protein [Candidatus Woesearchaeota archaeon]